MFKIFSCMLIIMIECYVVLLFWSFILSFIHLIPLVSSASPYWNSHTSRLLMSTLYFRKLEYGPDNQIK